MPAIPSWLAQTMPHATLLVVSDTNTLRACHWDNTLSIAYAHHHHYATPPHATKANADALATLAARYDAILAVGSGTINDLCKYAAHQCNIPYSVVATAPSMNGYLSSSASLKAHGYKQSFGATAPVMCIADTDVLRHAPLRMIQSGIGDTLCRSTIQADVQLSQRFYGTPDYAGWFNQMYVAEFGLLNAIEVSDTLRDSEVIDALMQALLISGAAMQDAGSSAPASQGEHMIAHLLEMRYPSVAECYYHGEVIAVTTQTMRKIQESVTLGNHYHPSPFPVNDLRPFADEMQINAWTNAYACKPEATIQLDPSTSLPPLLSTETLTYYLQRAGCPLVPQDIDLSAEDYDACVSLAPFTRDRLTYLDWL